MRSERFFELLGRLDDDIIESVQEARRLKKNRRVLKWSSFAASILTVTVLFSAIFYNITMKPPTYENALFDAEDIGKFMAGEATDGVPTSYYSKKYVPSASYLRIDPLPDISDISMYLGKRASGAPEDEKEFVEFFDRIISNVSNSTGIPIPEYQITPSGYISFYMGKYRIYSSQYYDSNVFSIKYDIGDDESREGVILDGVKVEIDKTKSNEEIIASTAVLRQKVLDMFGVDFSGVAVSKEYDSEQPNYTGSVSVYLYNESDSAINRLMNFPDEDYICIDIYNLDAETESRIEIYYEQVRSEYISLSKAENVKIIPLSDAEKLLFNGYVFGGYSCPGCMIESYNKEKVNFRNYDYVSLEYFAERTNDFRVIPFYVFYKNIGTSENGNEIYAYTFVPAIEVSGYKEYFGRHNGDHK